MIYFILILRFLSISSQRIPKNILFLIKKDIESIIMIIQKTCYLLPVLLEFMNSFKSSSFFSSSIFCSVL